MTVDAWQSQDLETRPALRRSLHRANELVDHAEWLIEENVDLHLQARADEIAKRAGNNKPGTGITPIPQQGGRASGRLRGIAVTTWTMSEARAESQCV